jgi:hypothetical protein
MTQPITFDVHVDQNEYLPEGGRVMDAAISVTARGDAGVRHGPPTAAQVIMIDSSGSMSGTRIAEAKKAIGVALDTLRDEVFFAIVAGTSRATMVYPGEPRMVAATAATREEARGALRGLQASNGTAIGTWLELANELLAGTPAKIKHGLLLTDGHNQHQTPEELRRTLERCRGRFVCDCRGVGDGWEARPLLEIADVLLGSAAGLPEPTELAADFQAVTEKVMGKAAANVSLRLWLLPGARVRFLKQMYPRIVDLTGRGTPVGPRVTDYPSGQWGAETRDYHVSLDVPAGAVDDEIRVAKVGMIAGDLQSEERVVRVRWTDDPVLSTRINAKVAHHTGQAELAEVIEEGLAGLAEGNQDVATVKLGRAVQLAEQFGHEDNLRALAKVVDIVDGTARLRTNMAQVDAEMAAVVSRTTVQIRLRSAERVDLMPIIIYLSDGDGHERVEEAVETLLRTAGWRIVHRDDPVAGSWFCRMWAKLGLTAGSAAAMAGHRVESELVRRPNADVTAMMLQYVGPVITALQPTKNAVIWAGAVLIMKVNGVVSVRELTMDQQAWLNRRPTLVTAPEDLAGALGLEGNRSPNGLPPAEDEEEDMDDGGRPW